MNAPSPDTIVLPWSPAQAAHLAPRAPMVQAATAWRPTVHPHTRPKLRRRVIWPAVAAVCSALAITLKAVAR